MKRLLAMFPLMATLVAGLTTFAGVHSVAAPPPAQGVRATPIGAPTWKPVDFHLFSAPIGTAPDYAEFGETMELLLPAPRHEWHENLGRGPGAAHPPPYDKEFAAGVATQGFSEGVRFATSQFSAGMGIWLVWMIVPAPGTTGSSPDFAAGPIIPNALFPIAVTATNWHNGKQFSNVAEFAVPPLDANLNPPFDVDGHSHVPIFLADNADFGPVGAKLRGSYRFQIDMTDATGQGWSIEAHYAVAP